MSTCYFKKWWFKEANTAEAAQLMRATCPDVCYDADSETTTVEKLWFQGKIRWIAQVISPLLEITEVSVFKIELNMLFQGGS